MRRTWQTATRTFAAAALYGGALGGCDALLNAGELSERSGDAGAGWEAATDGAMLALTEGGPAVDSGAESADDAVAPEGSNVDDAGPSGEDVDAQPTTRHDAAGGDAATRDGGGQEAAPNEGGSVGGPQLLVNPSFEQGYLGWSFSPPTEEGKDAYIQVPTGGASTVDGQYQLSTWSGTNAFTVRVYQVVSNLPDGTYTLSAWFQSGFNNQAYLFSTGCGGPAQSNNVPVTSPTGWVQITISSIAVTGGSCEVGVFVDASATDWLNVDAFSFSMTSSSTGD
jgi:hypothetical protein